MILYLSSGGDGDWVYIIVITIIFWLHNERKQIIVIINFFFSITIIRRTNAYGLIVQYIIVSLYTIADSDT